MNEEKRFLAIFGNPASVDISSTYVKAQRGRKAGVEQIDFSRRPRASSNGKLLHIASRNVHVANGAGVILEGLPVDRCRLHRR